MNRHALIACLLVASAATAQQSDMHLDLEIGTDLPLMVGGSLHFQAPHGIRVSMGLGVLPSAYVDLINEVLIGFDAYDAKTAALIQDTLKDSLVWRTHVGWIADFGLYIDVGYSLIALGGGTSAEAIVEAGVGRDVGSDNVDREYDVSSVLHMIDAEIGWKGVFWDAFVVRAALGFSGTVGSNAHVEQTFKVASPSLQASIDELEVWAEGYLEDTYETYVFTPVLTVSLGYRFF